MRRMNIKKVDASVQNYSTLLKKKPNASARLGMKVAFVADVSFPFSRWEGQKDERANERA